MKQKYEWNLLNISKSSLDSEDEGLTIGEWHLVSALLAIAERLEAQVEVMQKILEAVTCKGTVVRARADEELEAGTLVTWQPEPSGWKQEPDNLGPCGGE